MQPIPFDSIDIHFFIMYDKKTVATYIFIVKRGTSCLIDEKEHVYDET